MGLKKKLAALVGLVLISVSVANVELGALMNLDPPQKLILARAADPGCNADDIQKDLDAGEANACVTNPGVWDAADLLLLGEGILIFLASFMRWPRKGRWAIRIRKMAIVSGVILCGIALADRFDKLPGTSSEDLASLLPFPAPGIAVQIGLFAAGIFLIRGPKYKIHFEKEKKRKKIEIILIKNWTLHTSRAVTWVLFPRLERAKVLRNTRLLVNCGAIKDWLFTKMPSKVECEIVLQ